MQDEILASLYVRSQRHNITCAQDLRPDSNAIQHASWKSHARLCLKNQQDADDETLKVKVIASSVVQCAL
jgi:hypothetical protein